MDFQWNISETDATRIRDLVAKSCENYFVKARMARNLAASKPPIEPAMFWQALVACLLTTQQRSGPTSPVSRFIELQPFPLCLDACVASDDIDGYAKKAISDFGGLRFNNKIAGEIKKNLPLASGEGWRHCFKQLEQVRLNPTVVGEREAANFFDDRFLGFGAKQSRNLLQILGLTRFVLPIDSRLTKWLNKFGFPLTLNASLLGDRSYYELVEDGIQRLCERAGVFPCVLDAAIFASFDGDGWTEDNVQW